MCYYMSYLSLYHLVLFIEIDFYVLLHELSPIIPLGFIYRDWFLSVLVCYTETGVYKASIFLFFDSMQPCLLKNPKYTFYTIKISLKLAYNGR
jgi:hypothetical protein